MPKQENLSNVDAHCNIQGQITSAVDSSQRSFRISSCVAGPMPLPLSESSNSCDLTNSINSFSKGNMSVVTSSNSSITGVCSGVQNLSVTIPVSLSTFSTQFGNSVFSNLFPSTNNPCTTNFLEIPSGNNNNSSINDQTFTKCLNKPCLSNAVILPSSQMSLNFIKYNSTPITDPAPKLVATRNRQYRLLKKSPHKSLPLKKVSPILRQQFRRSLKCKVTSPRKLKFILPKQIRKKPRLLLSKADLPETCTPVNSNVGGSFQVSAGSPNIVQFGQNESGNDSCSYSYADKPTESCFTASISPIDASLSDQNLDLTEEKLECDAEDSKADQQLQLQEEHLLAFLKASSTIAMQRGGKKKNLSGLNKHQKVLQEKITALSYSPDLKSQEKDLAMSYLIRVRKALTSKDPKIFTDFVALFNNYSTATDSPEGLYFKVCDLLDGFDEFKEEFVIFLTPDQAVKVGKFHEYCLYTRMREFIDELKYHSSRQVQNFSKIFKTFQTLNNRSNISQEEFFDVLTPILRFQPHLIESLNRLLPSSQPMESLSDDFEVINMEDYNDETPEDFEVINMIDNDIKILTDNCFCHCHIVPLNTNSNAQSSQQAKMEHCVSCGLRFIDGRVYLQYGKSLRPTKIIYSTNAQEEKKSTVVDTGSSESQNKPKVPRKLKDDCAKLLKSKYKNKSRRIKLSGSSSSDSAGRSKKGKSSKRKFSKVQK